MKPTASIRAVKPVKLRVVNVPIARVAAMLPPTLANTKQQA